MEYKMDGWKLAFVILAIVFLVENVILIWAVYSVNRDDKLTYQCYYDICNSYPDATYNEQTKVCYCYDYDLLGNLQVATTKYMG